MILLTGFALVALGASFAFAGWYYRRQGSRLSSFPTVAPGAASPGGAGVVTGVARCPAPTTAPVTGAPCAFYEEEVQVLREWVGASRRVNREWRTVAKNERGGFFVQDAAGSVFVAPAGGELLFGRKPVEEGGALGAVDGENYTRVRSIQEGDAVCAAGTFRRLSEYLDHLRAGRTAPTLQAELIAYLDDLVRQGRDVPCLFNDGRPFIVADEGLDKVQERLGASADSWTTNGLLLAGMGAFVAIAAALGFIK